MRRRKPLARRTPMKCDKPLVNQAPLKRTGPVKAVNSKRKREKYDRNFGPEADAVRAKPCLACVAVCAMTGRYTIRQAEAAHVTARGMGASKGCNVDQVPLCREHHEEAGEARTSQRAAFEKRYGLDLRKSADDIAVGHPRPLGIRGLADRWSLYNSAPHDPIAAFKTTWWGQEPPKVERLSDHETDALMGWARREADRETERRRAVRLDASERGRAIGPCDPSIPDAALWPDVVLAMIQDQQSRAGMKPWDVHDDDHPDALAHHIATRLGGVFADGDRSLARALLDAAVQR